MRRLPLDRRAQELRSRRRIDFETSWAEISVGCEACHGPGSRHIAWASAARTDRAARRDSTKGLTARLDERRGVALERERRRRATRRARSRARAIARSRRCAQCHSRRSQIADGYEAGKPFLDYYRPALLSRPLYHADGQQRDEVYNWGSFLQSKMYARGVTCSDCHNPHSGKLRADGNAVCATCHLPAKYDTPAHHRHQAGERGRVVRRLSHADHDVHGRRPAARSQSAHSAAGSVRHARHAERVHELSYDARRTLGRRAGELRGTVTRRRRTRTSVWRALSPPSIPAQPTDRRGCARSPQTARNRRSRARRRSRSGVCFPTPTRSRRSPTACAIRVRSFASARCSPLNSFRSSRGCVSPSRCCPTRCRAIRIEAARMLADVPAQQLSPERQVAFERAAAEFVETQRYNADRAEARVSLGTFLAERGDAARAEEELQSAIRLEPSSIPAYVNLADVYRAQGRDADGERILRERPGGRAEERRAPLRARAGAHAFESRRHGAARIRARGRARTRERSLRLRSRHRAELGGQARRGDRGAEGRARDPSDQRRHPLRAGLVLRKRAATTREAERYRERLRALAANR